MVISAKLSAALQIAVVMIALGAPAQASIPLETLQKGCRSLLTGGHGSAAAEAMFSIRSWIKAVPETGAGASPDKADPTKTVFKDARNPVWCARSIESFILANQDSFPESLSDSELLPLWWASVHPAAEPRHKEWVQARLRELKGQKAASAARKK